jgi:rubrerythrin
MIDLHPADPGDPVVSAFSSNRRTFLRISGVTAVGLGLGSSRLFALPIALADGAAVDLGSGDTGILNYAYALEQLEAAFYTQVISSPYSNMTDEERMLLTDIRDHEIAHREFFKAALGTGAIPGLTPNFKKVKFNDRTSVLATALAFEDLGVAAYNGAGQLLVKPEYLLLAGKIVSVEARHAAVIADLITPRTDSFAPKPLDKAEKPADVLKVASKFITDNVTATSLPTA